MGGERFDTTQPEAYLFGENPDLNFLGNRPVPVSLKLFGIVNKHKMGFSNSTYFKRFVNWFWKY